MDCDVQSSVRVDSGYMAAKLEDGVTVGMRATVVDWLFDVAREFNFEIATAYTAVSWCM